MKRIPGEWIFIAVLIVAHLVLAAGFATAPPFEGADELEHYRYIRTLAQTGQLPDPNASWGGQYHQAPFYFLVMVPFRLGLDDPDFGQISARSNPFSGYALSAPGNDNKNSLLHRQAELFPAEGSDSARIAYRMRLITIMFSLGTLAASYATFHNLWPQRPDLRMLAMSVVAFHPHLAQVNGMISNDNLLIVFATSTLALLVWMERTGWSRWRAAGLGVILGLALLTKVNGMFLALPVGVAVLSNLRQRWRYAVLILMLVALIAGWWYLRNWVEYGDPTGGSVLFTLTQPGEAIATGKLVPAKGWPRLRFAYETFWARFADGRISAPRIVHDFYNMLVIVVGAGLVLKVGRHVRSVTKSRHVPSELERVQTNVIVVFSVAWALLLVYYSSRAWSGVQGRYLLPGIAGWAVLIAWGVDALAPCRARHWIARVLAAVLGVIAFVSLFGYYLSAYAVSHGNASAEVHYSFEGIATINGFEPATMRAYPGERISFTLSWVALDSTEKNLLSYLHSVESDVVRRDSYPATGNLLSTDWMPGDSWAEHYVVDIPADAEPGQAYLLVAGLYDPVSELTLMAFNANGEPVTPIVGRIAINRPDSPPFDSSYRFGDQVELAPPRIEYADSALVLCLTWRASRTMDVDYSLFVHVRDEHGTLIGQYDGAVGDTYPTGVWAQGEVIDQCITLTLPVLPDGGGVALGLYNLTDLARLPVTDDVGQSLALPDMIVLELP